MQEKGNKYPMTHSKRRATDPGLPPSTFDPHQQMTLQARGVRLDSPQVCQEETPAVGSALDLSSGSEVFPTESTPRTPDRERQHDEFASALPTRSHFYSSFEQFSSKTPPFSAEKNSSKSYTSPKTSAQDVHRRGSLSATVSREGSFRSFPSSASISQTSGTSLRERAQIAHMAIDMAMMMMAPITQKTDEWYRSNSSFSTTASARCTDSDTHSVQSEFEGVPGRMNSHSSHYECGKPKTKQHFQDYPPNAASIARDPPTPKLPADYAESSSACEDKGEKGGSLSEVHSPVVFREKKALGANKPRRHSVISDATLRQSAAVDNRRFSSSVPSSLKSQSTSDATSETTITSPRPPDLGRGMYRYCP